MGYHIHRTAERGVRAVNSSFSREGYLNEDYRFFHLRDQLGQERDFHFHDFDKIVVHLSGQVDYLVERATYRMRPGNVLLIKNHTIHKANIDQREPYERMILYLDGKFVERVMPGASLMECFDMADRQGTHLLTPAPEDGAALRRRLEELEQAGRDEQFAARALQDTLVVQVLILIGRIALSSAPAGEAARPPYDPKISDALSYINEHLKEELTAERLAERVFLSKYHFMRLFKAETGSTVHAYVRQRRLLYAAHLIRMGAPVTKAAADSGFRDYSTFFRAFRESFGVSPGQLR